MSEILFGQSYYLRFDPKLWQAMQPYPPLGSLYAAGYVRSRGYQVALFDAMLAVGETGWTQALDLEQPRFAVLFEDNFNYLSKMCLLRMRQAAFTMMAEAHSRGCVVIACGSDAADHALEFLEHGADFVLQGEGEETLGVLLDQQTGRSPQDLRAITGLVYLDPDGELIRTPRRPDMHNLDALPFPAWDLVDISNYQQVWRQRHGYFSMNMVTTRGCPFHCNWCAKPIWGQRYNMRSPENVVSEMKWLKEKYNPDQIWFMDDILGLKPGWLEHFADLLDQEGIHIPFKSLNRADLLLRGKTIDALRRAGAQIVWIGAESGSQEILDAMEKGTRIEQIYTAARQLHAAGIQVAFFLQFGYPGETLEDIEKTLQMVRDCHPDDIGISVSYPLPGTRFYEKVKAQLGVKQNWIDSQDLDMLYQGPFTTEFYRKLHTRVHKEFRMRQAWDELAWVRRHPEQVRPRMIRRSAAMFYNWITLPVIKAQISSLAKIPSPRLAPIHPELDPEAAAQPSPQGKQGGRGLIAENDHLKHVAEAFSFKALIYDEFGKDHPNLQRMRRTVYEHVLGFIKPGGCMLEINAGTGTDASHFASLGYKVHATDVSPGMLRAIQEKIVLNGLQDRLSSELCSFTELSKIKERSFDYVFSNFGGLNCGDDLNQVAREMKGLLLPGGRLTWVIMPPVCPWDLALAFKGEFHTATRRLKPGGTMANVEGVHFHVRYFTPTQVLRSLGKDFRLLKLEGLSIFAPPADRKNFALRKPALYKRLVWIDEHISSLPILRGLGDFFILSVEYRP